MNGFVDRAGRALLSLQVRSIQASDVNEMEVWIDTAFDGELVASVSLIEDLGLEQSAAVEAILADGEKVVLATYSIEIHWGGAWRRTEVVANRGRLPLLGIGLLRDFKLEVDYPNGTLRLS